MCGNLISSIGEFRFYSRIWVVGYHHDSNKEEIITACICLLLNSILIMQNCGIHFFESKWKLRHIPYATASPVQMLQSQVSWIPVLKCFPFHIGSIKKVGIAWCPITGKIYRHSSLITVGEVWEFRGNRFLRNEPGLPFIRCMAPHRYLSALFRVSSLSLQVIVLKLGQEDKASWQKSGFTIWPPLWRNRPCYLQTNQNIAEHFCLAF